MGGRRTFLPRRNALYTKIVDALWGKQQEKSGIFTRWFQASLIRFGDTPGLTEMCAKALD
jgi:hypothetical protein